MINDSDLLRSTAKRQRSKRTLFHADFAGVCEEMVLKYYGATSYDNLCTQLGFYNPKRIWPLRKNNSPEFDYSSYFKDIEIPQNGIFMIYILSMVIKSLLMVDLAPNP